MFALITSQKDKIIKKRFRVKNLFCGFFIGIMMVATLTVIIYKTTAINKPEANEADFKLISEKFESNPPPREGKTNPTKNKVFIEELKNLLKSNENMIFSSKKQTTQKFTDNHLNEEKDEEKNLKTPHTSTPKSVSHEEANNALFNINDIIESAKVLAPLVDVDSTVQKIENRSLSFLAAKVKKAIVPGTKLCDRGIIAASYVNLDAVRATDECCKQQDVCSESIEVGQTKHNLTNTGFFALSTCDCDDKFYGCLKKVDNVIADVTGFAYFTIFRTKCFKEDYPIVECKKWKYTKFVYKRRDVKRCAEYVLDLKSPKKYQFFDSPFYC